MSRSQWAALALVVPLLLGAAWWAASALGDTGWRSDPVVDVASTDTEFEHDFVIPAGTGARIEAGELVEIVPRELVVKVGESIRIVNEDDRDHLVGVFFVAAGETATQTFRRAAVLESTCTVHPSGQFRLIIEA